jgi:hypothetical protein
MRFGFLKFVLFSDFEAKGDDPNPYVPVSISKSDFYMRQVAEATLACCPSFLASLVLGDSGVSLLCLRLLLLAFTMVLVNCFCKR